MKARNRLNVDDKDEAGFSKCSTANFEIGCQNASASIALTQLLRLPLELCSGKSLLMCFLYLLKIFSYANIGGGSQATRLLQKGSRLGKVWEPLVYPHSHAHSPPQNVQQQHHYYSHSFVLVLSSPHSQTTETTHYSHYQST